MYSFFSIKQQCSETVGLTYTKKNRKIYSHLSNKRGGGAKVTKSITVEVGITLEVGFCFEKSINVEGGFLLCLDIS